MKLTCVQDRACVHSEQQWLFWWCLYRPHDLCPTQLMCKTSASTNQSATCQTSPVLASQVWQCLFQNHAELLRWGHHMRYQSWDTWQRRRTGLRIFYKCGIIHAGGYPCIWEWSQAVGLPSPGMTWILVDHLCRLYNAAYSSGQQCLLQNSLFRTVFLTKLRAVAVLIWISWWLCREGEGDSSVHWWSYAVLRSREQKQHGLLPLYPSCSRKYCQLYVS